MNTKLLYALLLPIVLISSCKKELITNITEVEEKPALNLKIYGVWQNLDYSPNNDSRKYIEYTESGYAIEYYLEESGVQSQQAMPFKATENLVSGQWGSMTTYKISSDTLTLTSSPSTFKKYVKSTTPDAVKGWVGTITNLATIAAPAGMNGNINGSFGFDGDFLFFAYNLYGNANMYKYNTLTDKFADSFTTGGNTDYGVFYQKSADKFIYSRSQSNFGLFKTTGFNSTASPASLNVLSNISNLSLNASSGTIYAFSTNSREMFAGTDGGTFSSLFKFGDLPNIYLYRVCYYKNDEFLVVTNGTLHKVKIAPSFSVVKSYKYIDNFDINNVSTDGTTVWISGYNYNANKYEFRKIQLED